LSRAVGKSAGERRVRASASPDIDQRVTAVGSQRKTLSREDWLAAALKVLERRGIGAVKIDALARQLKVTRGSFYFHFSGLKDLHEALLGVWRFRNRQPFDALANRSDLQGVQLFTAVVHVWVDEDPFNPMLDFVIREWSRRHRRLAIEVAEMDDLRLLLLSRSFRQMGYADDESVVRARITYFHQIGYYATAFKELAAERKRYQPLYGAVLLGPLGDNAK
jgi:AcrR family transcriptional regulator